MMVEEETLLTTLVKLVGRIPPAPVPARRRRPPTYPDHLFLQALAIMIVRHVHTMQTLLSFALSAVFVFQLTLWDRHEHGLDLHVGLKPFLKAA